MAGTIDGARRAKEKILANDPNFYKRIGAIGGRNGNTGGLTDRELARRAGRIGGIISRRGKTTLTLEERRKLYELSQYGKATNTQAKR